MKIWVDDNRDAPSGYAFHVRSVDGAIKLICDIELVNIKNPGSTEPITLIDLDHDTGDFAVKGGDYIKILDWLEATGRNYPIRIHSMNPVGVQNMRAIIQKNGWTEVL